MNTDQQEQPSASDAAFLALTDGAREAINENTDESGYARRWWEAETTLEELRRAKEDET